MFGSPSPRQLAPAFALILLGLILPHLLPQYFLYAGNLLMMYAVLALGFDILIGWSGQFAFAHIAFFSVGIYGTTLLHTRLGIPFVVGMPMAALAAGVIGLVIGIPAARLRSVYLALATFAFAESASWVLRSWDSVTNGTDGVKIVPASVFGYMVGTDRNAFPVAATILALVLVATKFLARSAFARSLAAVRESEHVATASGIDVARTKVLAFAISAVYAGIAGGMYTLFQSFVNPDSLDATLLILLLSMLVVGGTGSIAGVLVGVVSMGVLPEALRYAPRNMLVWQEFIYGLILVLCMMFMPRGVWGIILARRQRRASSAARQPAAPASPPPREAA
ncbi:MAG TPA: branched-chain amino acid ABC transporter permease [Ramlibacter sp.]|uniref:branched-chain amino acid ABC transporter permease n=1 Tax=Ramlibacter sp. TaxID=1917967 RepID=UPI002C122C38|nr:branched-chain amino acid ABC transporter permease [Ramlibacter sp.]HVZ42207.1 branched-chain amino acid ABC transporter permease [Ramlibacter sp.]